MYSVMLSQAVVAFNPFSAIWEGIKQVLGFIMNAIYLFFSLFGVENMALTIIFFTIVIYTILLPLTVKQQKTAKLNAFIQPEINAIQKKYKNKNDNESMMRQNEEMQAVYKKYGSSPTSGCLSSFIQLPIMLALYRVLYNVPKYVDSINKIFTNLAAAIRNTAGYEEIMADYASKLSIKFEISGLSDAAVNSKVTEVLYRFSSANWADLTGSFPKLEKTITETQTQLSHVNSFIAGIDIAESPSSVISSGIKEGHWGMVVVAVLIPLLAGALSWLSTKVSTAATGTNADQGKNSKSSSDSAADTMQSSMKMMNTIMPIFSIFICYSLTVGIGLYWIFSSLYRVVSMYFVNKHMEKVDVMTLVEKNVEKYNKKMEKKGQPQQKVNVKALANASTRNTEYDEQKKQEQQEKRKAQIEKSTEYYNSSTTAKPGSLRAKANMVAQYDERNTKGSKNKNKNGGKNGGSKNSEKASDENNSADEQKEADGTKKVKKVEYTGIKE